MQQSTFAGALNDWPIGHGVREWHAQLYHVCAMLNQSVHQAHGEFRVGITGRDIRDQGGLTLLF
jgi:hypothetical protein